VGIAEVMADVIEEIIAEANQTVTLKSGEVLFREFDEPVGMYIVKRGRLGVFVGGTPLETVRERGLIGEMAIVERNRPRSATVLASTYCELIFIDVERFLSLVASNPQFSIAVMQVMARRLRTMNSRSPALQGRASAIRSATAGKILDRHDIAADRHRSGPVSTQQNKSGAQPCCLGMRIQTPLPASHSRTLSGAEPQYRFARLFRKRSSRNHCFPATTGCRSERLGIRLS
jgi:CRP/FNR family cyclic AMP-dependent transcriptional regulator